MIYFDNSATSGIKPDCVLNAAYGIAKNLNANPGRSGHSLSVRAGMLVYSVRKKAAKLLGISEPENIIFTLNCTHALNYVISGTAISGGNVVTTFLEHNSVLRPLFELQKQGKITVSLVRPDSSGAISVADIERAITPRTYMVAVNHISNVTGAVNPIDRIGALCRKRGIKLLVDGAQSVGYCDIDMLEQNIDYLAVAPHKGLKALQGVGILAINRYENVSPVIFGGTGTNSESVFQPREAPEALESGTLPTPAIAALGAAISHNEESRAENRRKIRELSYHMIENLRKINGVTVYTAPDTYNGLISFNVSGIDSLTASEILSSQYDIAVRGGLHCAPLTHRHLGTLKGGIIRASINSDNSFSEADWFIRAIKELAVTERRGKI